MTLNLSQYTDFERAQERLRLGVRVSWSAGPPETWTVILPSGKIWGEYTSKAEAEAGYLAACREVEAQRAFGEAR